jgi:hypothetical protein
MFGFKRRLELTMTFFPYKNKSMNRYAEHQIRRLKACRDMIKRLEARLFQMDPFYITPEFDKMVAMTPRRQAIAANQEEEWLLSKERTKQNRLYFHICDMIIKRSNVFRVMAINHVFNQ